jgi:dephospho-CoA kinase
VGRSSSGRLCVSLLPQILLRRSNETLQLARLLARPPLPGQAPLTKAAAQARISSQLSLSSKLPYADHVLDNSGTPRDLQQQVDTVVAKWRKSQGGASGWWWKLCWLVPPLGAWVGAWALVWREVRRWRRQGKAGNRRRARGETMQERDDERIELREMGRRRTSGSSLLD